MSLIEDDWEKLNFIYCTEDKLDIYFLNLDSTFKQCSKIFNIEFSDIKSCV